MAYIGNIPGDKYKSLVKQTFSTSATATYTLDHAVSSVNDIELFLNNVRQEPTTAYTISGTTLTLASAITGSDSLYCIYQGRAVETIAPATGSVTLNMLSATGTKDSSTFLRGDNTFASAGGIFESQLFHVRDEKSNGTNGGSAQNTSFTVRDLNTILTNEITGASLSSNRITLPSGTFYVHASAPAYETNMHRVFLYNHSDSSNILFGGNATADSGSGSHSEVVGRFTLSASKNIELRHYTTNAGGVDALGRRVSQGNNEIFAQVLIWKVA